MDLRKSRARVNAGNRPGIDELIPHLMADAYQQDENAGDDGEGNHALADGSEGSARLAFGNRVAAGAIRQRAVLALATTASRARAGPVPFHLSRFHFQAGVTFVGRPALSLG